MTRIAIIASIAVCALIVPGCGQSDVIERYTVPKQPIIATAVGDSNRNVGDSQDVDMSRDRMLGAIVPRGKNSWFFKVTGPNGIVEDQMEEFLELIRSLRFSPPDNTPSWKLPVGWHREPDSQGMRFATIKIDTDADSLELSVIPLPTGSGDLDDYIVSNINRWREQLRLPPIGTDQLLASEKRTEETTRMDLEDGTNVTLVNLVGYSASNPMSKAPFAPFASKATPAGRMPPRSQQSQLKYEVPQGWQKAQGSALSKAAFAIEDGDQRVEVTVTDLSIGAAALLPNVNRWRQQIGLAETTQRELDAQRGSIKIGSLEGDYVELVGNPQAKRRETILAVIVVSSPTVWFIRLRGDSELATREKQRFEQFVRSIKGID